MLDDKDLEFLKNVFVTKAECNDITDGLNSQIANNNQQLAIIVANVKMIKWLVGVAIALAPIFLRFL